MVKMFGLGRGDKAETIDWTSLHSLLEDDDRRAAVHQSYPSESRESYLSALKRLEPKLESDVLAAGRRLHSAAQLVNWPTVAIAGMLNSGKTSLVATFLSEKGRARTLRGDNNDQGTHRFVLWLPAAWQKDSELWGLLMSRIGDAVGQPPEMLAEDPEQAHRQYSNHNGNADALQVPLVATDPRLEEAGIGLLDCPDIVSDESFGLGSPQIRRQILGRAATLCSAFMVVTSAESSRDQALGNLMRIASDLMPGIPRLLAVNKVRPRQTPDQVLEAFGPLARGHGIETVYAAYDFDVPASRPFIPVSDEVVAAIEPDADADPLPVFFSVNEDPDTNPPASITSDRLLSSLPMTLDRARLFEKFRVALELSLRSAIWDTGFKTIDHDADQSIARTDKAQHCLLQTALDFFAHREIGGEVTELRLHQSERIVRQLSESFAATAPWYARWGVRMNTAARRVFGGAGDLIRQLTPTAMARRTADEIKDKFRSGEYGGLMTSERLQNAIELHGGAISLPHWYDDSGTVDRVAWNDATEAAISRYERDDFTSLDPRRLDDAVRQMWAEVPMRKKLAAGLTPLAAMLATFGGVLMIPIDFGTSHFIAAASIPELLAAAGLTTLSTMWAGGQNTRNVGQQAARQQLADFQAVLSDTLGVARIEQPPTILVANSPERLPVSQIVVRDAVGPKLTVYRIRNEFRQELQRLIPRNGSAG